MVKRPCVVCGQMGQKLKCVECNTPYCSRTCHKADMTHKKLCKKILRLNQEKAKLMERNRYYLCGLAIAFIGAISGLFAFLFGCRNDWKKRSVLLDKKHLADPWFVHIGGKKEKQIAQGRRLFCLIIAHFYYFVSGVGYYLIWDAFCKVEQS